MSEYTYMRIHLQALFTHNMKWSKLFTKSLPIHHTVKLIITIILLMFGNCENHFTNFDEVMIFVHFNVFLFI